MMACVFPSDLTTWADFLVWPTSCNYYFYLIILAFLFIFFAWVMQKTEEETKGSGDWISSLGVSSIAITFLAVIGTLIVDSNDIPMIQSDILLYVVASTVVFIIIWFFKD